jgi:hypothetical protein
MQRPGCACGHAEGVVIRWPLAIYSNRRAWQLNRSLLLCATIVGELSSEGRASPIVENARDPSNSAANMPGLEASNG